jgi:hypothetical protein
MKINKVTITGIDNKIKYKDLSNFQDKYPFVEWGVLFSKNKEGEKRYPSMEYIKSEFTGNLKLSAHFCGWWAREILEKQNFDLILSLPKQFKRVQLNYNFKNSKGWNLDKLASFCEENKDISIILQYNRSNQNYLNYFISKGIPSNINFLYDSSGGNGKKIERIGETIPNHYTGYSGGIDSDNVESICEKIDIEIDKTDVWIDMESGVRTDNDLDLIKVEEVLEKCLNFI